MKKKITFWTKQKILTEARKYPTIRDWLKKDKLSYSAAWRMKILNEATKHMTRLWEKKWTNDRVIKAALKFKTFKSWIEKDKKSYAAATARGLLKDPRIANHLIKVEGKPIIKWTKEKVLNDAKKYKYKSYWKRNSPAAYRASKERGYFKEAISHMTLLGSKFDRCLYSISVKGKKTIYIGLTYNFEERVRNHIKSNRFKKLIKLYGRKSIISKKLSKYIFSEDAAAKEHRLIIKYKKLGYKLLNRMPAGGLGGNTLLWTKSLIIKDAKKYKFRHEWKDNSGSAYSAAHKQGYFKEATKHMKILNPKGKWSTKKAVLSDAAKYKHRSEWQAKSSGAYESAKLYGWYNEAIKHMTKPDMTIKWTKKALFRDARKYKYRSDWAKNSSGAYDVAKSKGWFEEAVKHMGNKKTIPIKWNKRAVLKDAKKYKYKIDWKKNSSGARGAARKGGYYEEAVRHMVPKKTGRPLATHR